jgi:DNA-binding response OmpR family regulator
VVVKAIKLGAVDFLPKNFAPPVLCARIETALRRKRNRDIEIEQEKQIETLKRASELLEKSIYDPAQLRLERVTTESTPLGNFARVFSGMAQQVYDRESRLRRQAQTLRGFGLLLLTNLSHVAVL